MNKKEFKPMRAFWIGFITVLLFSLGISYAMSIETNQDFSILFSQKGALLLLSIVWWAIIFGSAMSFIAWLGKRKQKIEEKDEINELMRQYLEKKLREEEGGK